MSNDNFVSKLTQGIGVIFTIGGIIFQYFLREEFLAALKISNHDDSFKAFSIAILITGIIIFIGLYANRHSLNNKVYACRRKSKEKYFNSIRKPAEGEKQPDYFPEPFYIDGRRLGWILLVFSITSFICIYLFNEPLIKSIFYLLFLLSAITSITIFLLSLYVFEEWKNREKERRLALTEKIKDYFAPTFKLTGILEDTSNFMYPSCHVIVELNGEKYKVTSDLNQPDKYFDVQKMEEAKQDVKK